MTVEQRLSQLEEAFSDLQKRVSNLEEKLNLEKQNPKSEIIENKKPEENNSYNNNDVYSNEYLKAFGSSPIGF